MGTCFGEDNLGDVVLRPKDKRGEKQASYRCDKIGQSHMRVSSLCAISWRGFASAP